VVQEVALDEECDEPDGQVLSHRNFEEEPKGQTWMHSAEALAEGLVEAKSTGHDVAELTSTAGRCNKKFVGLLVEALRPHQNRSQASSLAAATPPTNSLMTGEEGVKSEVQYQRHVLWTKPTPLPGSAKTNFTVSLMNLRPFTRFRILCGCHITKGDGKKSLIIA
jgi:hypothetical protein